MGDVKDDSFPQVESTLSDDIDKKSLARTTSVGSPPTFVSRKDLVAGQVPPTLGLDDVLSWDGKNLFTIHGRNKVTLVIVAFLKKT